MIIEEFAGKTLADVIALLHKYNIKPPFKSERKGGLWVVIAEVKT